MIICNNTPKNGKCKFNEVNENIDWAKWSVNPITGCETGCAFCYARPIAHRFRKNFPFDFEPTFYPHRLQAPQNVKIPRKHRDNPAYRNVFLCSMSDMFGPWVERKYIDMILDSVEAAPQWNFIILTKFPRRLLEFKLPANTWVGTTVHVQSRVGQAVDVFKDLEATVKLISCEPMMEQLTFPTMKDIDWVIVGARSKANGLPAFQPAWPWVTDLVAQARQDGTMIYMKPNLIVPAGVEPIKEYPEAR